MIPEELIPEIITGYYYPMYVMILSMPGWHIILGIWLTERNGSILLIGEAAYLDYKDIIHEIKYAWSYAELNTIYENDIHEFMTLYMGNLKDYDDYYRLIMDAWGTRKTELWLDGINEERGTNYNIQLLKKAV